MNDFFDKWSDLWTGDKGQYVLVTEKDPCTVSAKDCMIHDVLEGSLLVIEDEEAATEVKSRMFDSGISIVHVGEIRLGESALEVLANKLLESGLKGSEVTRLLKEAREKQVKETGEL